MKIRKVGLLVVMGVALTAIVIGAVAVPVSGSRARADVRLAKPPAPAVAASANVSARAASKASDSRPQRIKRREGSIFPSEPMIVGGDDVPSGKLHPRAMSALGFSENPGRRPMGRWPGAKKSGKNTYTIQSGQPTILNARSALSAALMTTLGGRDTQFSEVTLIADWDGREDCAADREAKVDDFSNVEGEIDFTLTRTAISEHTIANGFNENIFYYGDSVGNVWIGADTTGDGRVDQVQQLNLPTQLGGFPLDDQVTITGLAVNPVADFGLGAAGEILWGTFTDTEGFSVGGGSTVSRSGLFFILLEDTPGVGFPVTITGPALFATSSQSALGGVAVDDDGNVYFHLADLIRFTNATIFKIFDADGDRFPDIAFVPYTQSPNVANTPTPLFGNIVSMTNGPCNTIYAAVARSFVPGDVSFDQLTMGLFANPSALGPTPSMIISFADCAGGFDGCSGITEGSVVTNVGGTLPIRDHFADGPAAGVPVVPGVNNFRVFALGNGPDIRTGTSAIVTTNTLKVDMQIDFSAHAGITVDENGSVYVISGGQPAGIGKNPSPMLGEILCFEDACPANRRADFVDLRADILPNPPASGGNVGDGDSDRFDHIFYQAPLDQVTLTPTGLSGLSRGFLRYTNRLAPNLISPGVTLGSIEPVQGDDDSDGVIIFENLDPGHQVAGGDDQNSPFRGDDNDGAGNPILAGAFSGGFEFVFGGPRTTANCVWNGFFLNSNGNITFGEGDTSNVPNVPDFRSGPPKIAPAWADLNPNARAVSPLAFPVQAMGFSGVNSFKVRWINVPEFGLEDCEALDNFGFPLSMQGNTFSVTLFDDGTIRDENEAQVLDPADPTGDNEDPAYDEQEGPTDSRFTREPNTGVLVGCSPRPDGSGIIIFDYCQMSLLGTAEHPVITGYSIGFLDPLNPPGLCEINMSKAALAADANPFGVLSDTNQQTANICANCCIGEGTEPTLFELFNEGRTASTGSGGEVTFAFADFDLRFEGNDPLLCSSARQRDVNRGRVCLFGIGCTPPANPTCQQIVNGPFVTTPTTTGLVNALCAVQLNLVGCGFFPNETTIICQGFATETGIPLQRPGKTVTTAATLVCDTNGDTIPEATIVLTNVTPVNCNLVRGTIPVLASRPGTGFADACCGGPATVTVTTTFTAGDNNAFGAFTRTTTCPINLGTRAPVVFSVTPSDGNCAVTQDLLISGACFCFTLDVPGGTDIVGGVTSVIFQERNNPANTITLGLNPTTQGVVTPLTCQLIDVEVNFTSANAGKTFLVFVVGTGGTSRNLTTLPAGAPAGCPLGNEQGIQVTFTCASSTTPTPSPTPDIAVVTGCRLDRQTNGVFFLDVTGTNIKAGATATVGGVTPKKVKVVEVAPGTTNPTKLRLVKRICGGLPGNVIITNPGPNGAPSQPFNCTERCPAQ